MPTPQEVAAHIRRQRELRAADEQVMSVIRRVLAFLFVLFVLSLMTLGQ